MAVPGKNKKNKKTHLGIVRLSSSDIPNHHCGKGDFDKAWVTMLCAENRILQLSPIVL